MRLEVATLRAAVTTPPQRLQSTPNAEEKVGVHRLRRCPVPLRRLDLPAPCQARNEFFERHFQIGRHGDEFADLDLPFALDDF